MVSFSHRASISLRNNDVYVVRLAGRLENEALLLLSQVQKAHYMKSFPRLFRFPQPLKDSSNVSRTFTYDVFVLCVQTVHI